MLFLGTLLAALAAAWFAGGGTLWEESWQVLRSPEALRESLLDLGVWAPVGFFLAQVAQVILAPVPGGATAVVGTLIFGPWLGTALIIAGGVVGSVVLFALVRRWGSPLAVRLVGRKNFERFAGAMGDEKGALLFIVMLVPFVPDDVAVAVAGLSAVSFRRFVVVLALGRLPGWAVTAFVAADLMGRSTGTLVMVGLVVAVVATPLFLYRKRLESRLLWRTGAGQKRRVQARKKPLPGHT